MSVGTDDTGCSVLSIASSLASSGWFAPHAVATPAGISWISFRVQGTTPIRNAVRFVCTQGEDIVLESTGPGMFETRHIRPNSFP